MKKISGAKFILPLLLVLSLNILAACGSSTSNATTSGSNAGPITVHLGYFPNITHAVALVGVARGTFAQAFGKNVKLDTKQF
ncbi:MAG TPA: sulfate ABC transporter substrate-binding protein, partial [Ktedonobacteraceae bacterium]